ncbi:MAG: DUF2577 domain-containing protein [Lachnospiraceae bacterium]|nr:DUF2577 domain-containing protein [Lachnospiraceae bacterium]
MPDATDLVKLIKQASLDVIDSIKPVNVFFGEVISSSPLKINVEQKMILGENQLILSRNVKDFETEVDIDFETEAASADMAHSHNAVFNVAVASEVLPEESEITINNTVESSMEIGEAAVNSSHSHTLSGRKKITVHNSLVAGDKVILIRQQEGQKFIVIDRIGK